MHSLTNFRRNREIYFVNLNRKVQSFLRKQGITSCKPFFSKNSQSIEIIALANDLVTNESEIASIFISYFVLITSNLNIQHTEHFHNLLSADHSLTLDIGWVINKFSNHPTMLVRNYRDKRAKRCCSGSHKQCKTLFKDHMVRFKIISLYIYKDLRSNVSRDHYHEDENLVPSVVLVSKLLFSFEA